MYCSILAPNRWFGYEVTRLTEFLLGFYCSAVHVLLKSVTTFFVGALGIHTSEKGIQTYWKVWLLMYKLLRSIQPFFE